MVKGNWERRCELALQRRLENKERKEKKKTAQKVANGDSVFARLSTFEDLFFSRIDSYLEKDSGDLVCSSFMRTGECTHKKCKFSHDCEPIFLMNTEKVFGVDQEINVFHVPFREVHSKHRLFVRFVGVDGLLVFDHLNPDIWNKYLSSRNTEHIDSIKEQSQEDIFDKEEIELNTKEIEPNSHFAEHSYDDEDEKFYNINNLEPLALHVVLGFCSNQMIFDMLLTCKNLKLMIHKDSIFRSRRRDSLGVISGVLSKQKKEAKKKKIKTANIKKAGSKKDEFARGGPGGQR